jgi:hypothetical protein
LGIIERQRPTYEAPSAYYARQEWSDEELRTILHDFLAGQEFQETMQRTANEHMFNHPQDGYQKADYTYDESPETKTRSHNSSALEVEVPASPEVDAYAKQREREDMYDEAKAENDRRNVQRATDVILDKAETEYGAKDLSGLNDDQLRRVEKKVAMALHPDKGYSDGGDVGASQEAARLLHEVRRSRDS